MLDPNRTRGNYLHSYTTSFALMSSSLTTSSQRKGGGGGCRQHNELHRSSADFQGCDNIRQQFLSLFLSAACTLRVLPPAMFSSLLIVSKAKAIEAKSTSVLDALPATRQKGSAGSSVHKYLPILLLIQPCVTFQQSRLFSTVFRSVSLPYFRSDTIV